MNEIICILLMLSVGIGATEFRVGVARKVITPTESIWMAGYASRTRPSECVLHDLWAKALAFEDAQGERVVIVTTDLVGLPRDVSDEVAARVKEKRGLERRQLMLNSSHTHSGPVVDQNLKVLFNVNVDPHDEKRFEWRIIDYRNRLVDNLVEVVEAALADLSPATLAVGHGSVGFAINRRQQGGPVDHDVPVLKITSPDGKLRAVLFGYACHNTTLNGYQINGDYAGFAQIELEKALPGTTVMFLMLCGGDQNPSPRRTVELAAQHGKTLANEVQRVLVGAIEPVQPAIRTAYEEVKLDFARQDRAVFEREAKSGDRFRRHRAEAVLAALDAGRPVRQMAVPVQVIRFNAKLAMIALGDEPVVDYSLRLKREYPNTDLIVAGYTNEVVCYIPSRRVLAEKYYAFHDNSRPKKRSGPFSYIGNRGSNVRMTEFQGAVLAAQMTRLEAQAKARGDNGKYLTGLLREIPGIAPARMYDGCTQNAYHLYMFRYDSKEFAGLSRQTFINALAVEGIPASSGYGPLNRDAYLKNAIHSRGYQKIYSKADLDRWAERTQCSVNDRLCQEAVWFAQNMLLGDHSDMDQIAEAIRKIKAYATEVSSI